MDKLVTLSDDKKSAFSLAFTGIPLGLIILFLIIALALLFCHDLFQPIFLTVGIIGLLVIAFLIVGVILGREEAFNNVLNVILPIVLIADALYVLWDTVNQHAIVPISDEKE